jgi:hypothetical protein
MSSTAAPPPVAFAERKRPVAQVAPHGVRRLRVFGSRLGTFALVELQKLRHDRTELVTRAVQPMLWLVIFGETFSRIRAIDTSGVPYLSFLAPGIIAQSALFISIFYGIQIIWDRDAEGRTSGRWRGSCKPQNRKRFRGVESLTHRHRQQQNY